MEGLNSLNNSQIAETYNNINKNKKEVENLKNSIETAQENFDSEKLMEACKSFESYFMQMMYKSMRQTINYSDGFIPQSNAQKIFQDMLDEQHCKTAAEGNNGVGLAKALYKQLSRRYTNSNVNSETDS